MATLAQAFELAVTQYQAGHIPEAESICRQILVQVPRQSDTLHLLGVIEHRAGRNEEAQKLIERAIGEEADNPNYHLNLGIVRKALGRLDQAVAAYREAVRLKGEFAEALCNLGNVLWEQGAMEEAAEVSRRAVAARPDLPQAHNNLGNALKALGRPGEAIAAYQQSLRLRPNDATVCRNLGNLLQLEGRDDEALALLQKAVKLDPHGALGYHCLGHAYQDKGWFLEARRCYEQALSMAPADADLLVSLGNVLKDLGEPEQALARYREALRINPRSSAAWSNMLFTTNYLVAADRMQVFAEHLAWGRQVIASVPRPGSHANDRDPQRRLRVGYVSPDFRSHAVACFLLPILQYHNPRDVEVFCYAQVPNPDGITTLMQRHAQHWRNTCGVPDEKVAQMILDDRIDILVDLAGHTDNNRLPVFARRPAPVQVTYLGYSNTTGLETIDYRISDAAADPEDDATPYCEKLIRLEGGFTCYAPPIEVGDVAPLPALSNGFVTFGSIANPAKLNDQVIHGWSRVLLAVPQSRLLMARDCYRDEIRSRLIERFVGYGISPERLMIEEALPSPQVPRIRVYDRIDISLDTFPYTGHTTVCESLWMGVPVVSLIGRTLVARQSASILTYAGLEQLLARTPEDFARIATDLAGDLPRLAELRAGLRQRVAHSALCDADGFTRRLESVYRDIWRQWCAKSPAG